jgi:hypothetical protein
MKLAIAAACAALVLAAGPAAGQTRVSVSVGVHVPPVSGHVVIGGPHRLPRSRIVVVRTYPRHRVHRGAIVVVRPYGHVHGHGRPHRHWHRHRR